MHANSSPFPWLMKTDAAGTMYQTALKNGTCVECIQHLWLVPLQLYRFFILMVHITGLNFRYRCNRREVHAQGFRWWMGWWSVERRSQEVGAFTESPLRWFQPAVVRAKKEYLHWSVLEGGTWKGLEFRIAWLSKMFSLKSVLEFCGPRRAGSAQWLNQHICAGVHPTLFILCNCAYLY